jgi:uncharacterized protein
MHRRPDGKLIVSATDLVGFLECGHLTQLDRAAAAGHIRKPDRSEDPEVQLLQRRGGEHEQRYLDQLRADSREVTDLSRHKDLPYEEQAALTVVAMERGDDVIFQATVFDGRWVGHPDFLLRVNTPLKEVPSAVSRFADSGIANVAPLTASRFDDSISPSIVGHPLSHKSDSNGGGGIPRNTGLGRDWHYEVADTKLAHNAKAGALIQICSYVDHIERIQDVRPEKVYVVTGGAEIAIHDFRTAEMMAYYRHVKTRFEEALDETARGPRTWPIPREESYPDPVDHCSVCRWYPDYCRVQWRDDDALKLVAGISRDQRKVLTAHTVTTMHGLGALTQPLQLDLKRGQNDSMWRMREQARLQVATGKSKVPFFELLEPEKDEAGTLVADRGLSALPKPDAGDLFFDIEGDPFVDWIGLEYLFGIWEGGEGDGLWDQGSYRGLWALNREDEKKQFEQVMDLFVERWKQFPDMHIYHYAPYEPTALKRLAGRHATREEELDQLLRGRVFVDLYRVVRQGVRVGAEKYSIKNLEPLYGYDREIDLRSAGESIVEFEFWLDTFRREGRSDQPLLDRIELYNRDDCVSTERLRDWLEERRLGAAETWGGLPRPPAPAPEAAEVVRPSQIAVRELEARLTATVPAAAANRTTEQQSTWLLAQLLGWHNRERKSTWWRFFELMTLSPDELLTEKEPIGGLTYEGVVGTTRPGNVIHRYRYPAQEHDVGDSSSLHDPSKPAFEGSKVGGHKIDDANLTLDITRPPEWTGPHPNAVVPDNAFYTDAQEEALLRIGRWVAQNGIGSPAESYRAARDLLLRQPPRVGQSANEYLVRTDNDETGTLAARRLAMTMDGTTLPIQGPPGSGKTYTGARMILDLVRAGKRVAITSNSHKVIGNLLRAVCDAAEEYGFPLRAMQKGEKDEVITHRYVDVKRAADNREMVTALDDASVDVAAGTPWLWAREDMERKIDTLFIDEAGQVSLANVVAVSGSAANVVLLGDPQQLDQPTQGVHPDGAGRSALAHLLDGAEVVNPAAGVFLEKTWRMHPSITRFTSELFYEGELESVDGLERQQVIGNDGWSGAGLRWEEVVHEGNTDASEEEARRIVEIVRSLLGRTWVLSSGEHRQIKASDILIVSPFNAHRLLIDRLLKEAGLLDVPVGTVDKFQGQEAAVSIYTMATSRPEDAPRGMGFLFSLNRLNVATSRARALAIVVASPALLSAVPRSPDQLRMVNGLCAFVEEAALD